MARCMMNRCGPCCRLAPRGQLMATPRLRHLHALPEPESLRPIDRSRKLAWSREQESQQATPLFSDPYASALAATAPQGQDLREDADALTHHVLTTKYLDELLMNAMNATNVNRINKGDYRQVVLVGDGMDTRPFRLSWPEGTVLFMVAPSETHELAEAVLKQAGAKVPRGCLLRRVNADLQRPGSSFTRDMESKGFRGDRLSVWALQGLSGLGLDQAEINGIFTDITNLAAFNSLVFGELPDMPRTDADNLLAGFGLLGATMSPKEVDEGAHNDTNAGQQEASSQRAWLFSSQHMRLSLAQMGVYDGHRREYEEVDEDYTDNFS